MICNKCGTNAPSDAKFCPKCGNVMTPAAPQNPMYGQYIPNPVIYDPAPVPVKPVRENIPLGMLGALGGAILGGASIILFDLIGIVASFSGLILAFCTLMGYQLLGKKLGPVGIVFCVLLMLVTPYLADRINWAIFIVKEIPFYTFAEAFADVHELADGASYGKNIAMVYIFTLIGGVGTVVSTLKKK